VNAADVTNRRGSPKVLDAAAEVEAAVIDATPNAKAKSQANHVASNAANDAVGNKQGAINRIKAGDVPISSVNHASHAAMRLPSDATTNQNHSKNPSANKHRRWIIPHRRHQ